MQEDSLPNDMAIQICLLNFLNLLHTNSCWQTFLFNREEILMLCSKIEQWSGSANTIKLHCMPVMESNEDRNHYGVISRCFRTIPDIPDSFQLACWGPQVVNEVLRDEWHMASFEERTHTTHVLYKIRNRSNSNTHCIVKI